MPNLIELDALGTHAGLLERLCLHETRTPAYRTYNEADSVKAMWFIRQMMANRLRFPRVFSNREGIREVELLRVPNQFPGFETYPNLSAAFMRNVTDCLRLANDPRAFKHAQYLKHVQNAITVARAPSVPADQVVVGAAGWKKEDTASPGSRYVLWRTLQGNDYYTTPMR